jgi:hypothetical protein
MYTVVKTYEAIADVSVHTLEPLTLTCTTACTLFRYPFDPCRMRITEGTPCLPPSLVSNNIVTLPEAATWTPSHTVIGMLQDLVKHVVAANSGGSTTAPSAAEQQGVVVTVSTSVCYYNHACAYVNARSTCSFCSTSAVMLCKIVYYLVLQFCLCTTVL